MVYTIINIYYIVISLIKIHVRKLPGYQYKFVVLIVVFLLSLNTIGILLKKHRQLNKPYTCTYAHTLYYILRLVVEYLTQGHTRLEKFIFSL